MQQSNVCRRICAIAGKGLLDYTVRAINNVAVLVGTDTQPHLILAAYLRQWDFYVFLIGIINKKFQHYR